MRVELPATGMLRHHFHGVYSATIGLIFERAGDAKIAAALLGEGWRQGDATPTLVLGTFGGDAYDAAHAKLVSFGADATKVGSIRTSIDRGEPFGVTVTGEWADPRQGILF